MRKTTLPKELTVKCIWEHNGNDTLLYAVEQIGAFTRADRLNAAIAKMPDEIKSYSKWCGVNVPERINVVVVGEKSSDLRIHDADSDVLFERETMPLRLEEYRLLKSLAMKSAKDFLSLYESIPDKTATDLSERSTFYGLLPRTADEMYAHTKNVTEYYFAEIGVDTDNSGDIVACRERGFSKLETKPDFLQNEVVIGSFGEGWSLRKLIRRFIWHDRIHAKAMFRMACRVFGSENVANPFCFSSQIMNIGTKGSNPSILNDKIHMEEI